MYTSCSLGQTQWQSGQTTSTDTHLTFLQSIDGLRRGALATCVRHPSGIAYAVVCGGCGAERGVVTLFSVWKDVAPAGSLPPSYFHSPWLWRWKTPSAVRREKLCRCPGGLFGSAFSRWVPWRRDAVSIDLLFWPPLRCREAYSQLVSIPVIPQHGDLVVGDAVVDPGPRVVDEEEAGLAGALLVVEGAEALPPYPLFLRLAFAIPDAPRDGVSHLLSDHVDIGSQVFH